MKKIIFILVNPAVPENIGACARAIKTMGFACLRIVGSEQHLQKKARILAHGATDILDGAETYEDLASAVEDIDWVIGTSAKPRIGKRYSYSAGQLGAMIEDKAQTIESVAIVFGCEEAGLSNVDLEHCDSLSYVAIARKYPSLNLGQAVMIYAYELAAFSEVNRLEIASPEADSAKNGIANNDTSTASNYSPNYSPNYSQSWKVLKGRVANFLERIDVAQSDKLSRWALERLAIFTAKDVDFLHLLLGKMEVRDRQSSTEKSERRSSGAIDS